MKKNYVYAMNEWMNECIQQYEWNEIKYKDAHGIVIELN